MAIRIGNLGRTLAGIAGQKSAAADEFEHKLARVEQQRVAITSMYSHAEEFVMLHRTVSERIDWVARARERAPQAEVPEASHEAAALSALEAYKPTLGARLSGRAREERAALESAVAAAREADAAERAEREAAWLEETRLARRLLGGEPAALLAVVEWLDPFGALPKLGKRVQLSAPRPFMIAAELEVHIPDAIPRDLPVVDRDGSVEVATTPEGRFRVIYSDHVCSAVLRIARELFALTPVDTVLVTARGELPDASPGGTSAGVLVSVRFPRKEFSRLLFPTLQPLRAVQGFEHRMKFDVFRGFHRVEPLDPSL